MQLVLARFSRCQECSGESLEVPLCVLVERFDPSSVFATRCVARIIPHSFQLLGPQLACSADRISDRCTYPCPKRFICQLLLLEVLQRGRVPLVQILGREQIEVQLRDQSARATVGTNKLRRCAGLFQALDHLPIHFFFLERRWLVKVGIEKDGIVAFRLAAELLEERLALVL